ncbi:MAG: histidinol-phosphate transaminase [Verrucomicrobiota bacterium]
MSSFIRKAVREMAAYTPGEQPKERDIVKLNTNENAYPPSPKIGEVLRQPADRLRLYPDPVCTNLREALAELHRCKVEQIFVGNGSDEVLALCVRALVERDGTVGYFEPSYSLYPVLAAIQEIAVKPVRLKKDFTWNMPANYAASLFFLANPNAPTSVQYPVSSVQSFCQSFSGVVLIDEAYVDFSAYNCMDMALSLPNVLVARTLSKSFSLAGLRLGYVVGPEPLISALYKIKDSYNVDRLAQEIALAAVSDLGPMRRNVERIKVTRDRVAAELRKRGFTVSPSETNFLWAKPPKLSAQQVFEELRKRKILVRYFPGELTGAHLRITIATDGEMDALLTALDEIL